jgi:hypothetical protein
MNGSVTRWRTNFVVGPASGPAGAPVAIFYRSKLKHNSNY